MDKSRLLQLEIKCKELQKNKTTGIKSYLISLKNKLFLFSLKPNNLKKIFNFKFEKISMSKSKKILITGTIMAIGGGYYLISNKKDNLAENTFFDFDIKTPSFIASVFKLTETVSASEQNESHIILTPENNITYEIIDINNSNITSIENNHSNVSNDSDNNDSILLDYQEISKRNIKTSHMISDLPKGRNENIVYLTGYEKNSPQVLTDEWFVVIEEIKQATKIIPRIEYSEENSSLIDEVEQVVNKDSNSSKLNWEATYIFDQTLDQDYNQGLVVNEFNETNHKIINKQTQYVLEANHSIDIYQTGLTANNDEEDRDLKKYQTTLKQNLPVFKKIDKSNSLIVEPTVTINKKQQDASNLYKFDTNSSYQTGLLMNEDNESSKKIKHKQQESYAFETKTDLNISIVEPKILTKINKDSWDQIYLFDSHTDAINKEIIIKNAKPTIKKVENNISLVSLSSDNLIEQKNNSQKYENNISLEPIYLTELTEEQKKINIKESWDGYKLFNNELDAKLIVANKQEVITKKENPEISSINPDKLTIEEVTNHKKDNWEKAYIFDGDINSNLIISEDNKTIIKVDKNVSLDSLQIANIIEKLKQKSVENNLSFEKISLNNLTEEKPIIVQKQDKNISLEILDFNDLVKLFGKNITEPIAVKKANPEISSINPDKLTIEETQNNKKDNWEKAYIFDGDINSNLIISEDNKTIIKVDKNVSLDSLQIANIIEKLKQKSVENNLSFEKISLNNLTEEKPIIVQKQDKNISLEILDFNDLVKLFGKNITEPIAVKKANPEISSINPDKLTIEETQNNKKDNWEKAYIFDGDINSNLIISEDNKTIIKVDKNVSLDSLQIANIIEKLKQKSVENNLSFEKISLNNLTEEKPVITQKYENNISLEPIYLTELTEEQKKINIKESWDGYKLFNNELDAKLIVANKQEVITKKENPEISSINPDKLTIEEVTNHKKDNWEKAYIFDGDINSNLIISEDNKTIIKVDKNVSLDSLQIANIIEKLKQKSVENNLSFEKISLNNLTEEKPIIVQKQDKNISLEILDFNDLVKLFGKNITEPIAVKKANPEISSINPDKLTIEETQNNKKDNWEKAYIFDGDINSNLIISEDNKTIIKVDKNVSLDSLQIANIIEKLKQKSVENNLSFEKISLNNLTEEKPIIVQKQDKNISLEILDFNDLVKLFGKNITEPIAVKKANPEISSINPDKLTIEETQNNKKDNWEKAYIFDGDINSNLIISEDNKTIIKVDKNVSLDSLQIANIIEKLKQKSVENNLSFEKISLNNLTEEKPVITQKYENNISLEPIYLTELTEEQKKINIKESWDGYKLFNNELDAKLIVANKQEVITKKENPEISSINPDKLTIEEVTNHKKDNWEKAYIFDGDINSNLIISEDNKTIIKVDKNVSLDSLQIANIIEKLKQKSVENNLSFEKISLNNLTEEKPVITQKQDKNISLEILDFNDLVKLFGKNITEPIAVKKENPEISSINPDKLTIEETQNNKKDNWEKAYIFDGDINSNLIISEDNKTIIKVDKNVSLDSLQIANIIEKLKQKSVENNLSFEKISLNNLTEEKPVITQKQDKNISLEILDFNDLVKLFGKNITEPIAVKKANPEISSINPDKLTIEETTNNKKDNWEKAYILDGDINSNLIISEDNKTIIKVDKKVKEQVVLPTFESIKNQDVNIYKKPKTEQDEIQLPDFPILPVENLKVDKKIKEQISMPSLPTIEGNKNIVVEKQDNSKNWDSTYIFNPSFEPNQAKSIVVTETKEELPHRENNSIKNIDTIKPMKLEPETETNSQTNKNENIPSISLDTIDFNALIKLFSNDEVNNKNNNEAVAKPSIQSIKNDKVKITKNIQPQEIINEEDSLSLEPIELSLIHSENNEEYEHPKTKDSLMNYKYFDKLHDSMIEATEIDLDVEFKNLNVISNVDEPEKNESEPIIQEQPKAEHNLSQQEQPKQEVVQEQPKQEVVQEQPKQEVVQEQPKQEIVQEQPKQEIVQEQPKQEVIQEQPKQEIVQEQPKQVIVQEQPKQEVVQEQPKQEIVTNTQKIEIETDKNGYNTIFLKPILNL